MGQRIVQVDAFTTDAFGGNPAAVCVLERSRDERWMSDVAREMNLSETAFLERRGDGWSLRWFTPAREVDLCGHATLASAHVLWTEEQQPANETLRFHTRSGVLTARRVEEQIELDFPATPPEPAAAPEWLSAALGAAVVRACTTRFDLMVELESEEVVRALRPDFGRLRDVGVRGVLVTAPSADIRYDFVSRYFAPAYGIDEDPVTGSTHCALAPYWAERTGKRKMTGFQASARGGVVGVELAGDRVLLRGTAVTVLRGELLA